MTFENAFESSKATKFIDPTADPANYPTLDAPDGEGYVVAVVGSKHAGMEEFKPKKWRYDIDGAEYQNIVRVLTAFHQKHTIKVLVSGAATGADSIGEAFAYANDIPVHIHPAKWDTGALTKDYGYGPFNPAAGINRNEFIIRDSELTLAFPTDWKKSKGTSNSITRSLAAKHPTWTFDHAQGQHYTNPAAEAFKTENK